MSRKPPESLLPLTPAVLHILLVLADGERHGYAIAQEVESMSDGQVRMGPGTLELQRLNAVMNVARRKQLLGAPLPEGAS